MAAFLALAGGLDGAPDEEGRPLTSFSADFATVAAWHASISRPTSKPSSRARVPVGGFIVDFLAPSSRVVVEVDGGYHCTRRATDARRDAKLARMGYRVLRLEAEMVSHRIEEALERIRAALGT